MLETQGPGGPVGPPLLLSQLQFLKMIQTMNLWFRGSIFACQASNPGLIPGAGIILKIFLPYMSIFTTKYMKNQNFQNILIMKNFLGLSRQYIYLQLEKPYDIQIEIPIHKTLAKDLLKGGPTGPPPGSDRVNFL